MGNTVSAIDSIHSRSEKDILEALKSNLLDYQAQDQEEKTALHWAAAKNMPELALELIEKGIDVNAVDVFGQTPLHQAAFQDSLEVAETLMKKGANVNAPDEEKMTPLHWAVENCAVKCIPALLKNGAKKDLENRSGRTAKMLAKGLKRRQREKILPLLEGLKVAQVSSVAGASDALVSLCMLWGCIKYTHPYLAYRTDICWDKALVETIPKLVGDVTPESYKDAVAGMLTSLKDPNTRVIDQQKLPSPRPRRKSRRKSATKQTQKAVESAETTKDEAKVEKKPADQVEEAILPAKENGVTKEVKKSEKPEAIEKEPETEPQPNVVISEITDIALITITDYDQFKTSSKREAMDNAFSSAMSASRALVFDFRCINPKHSAASAAILVFIFTETFKVFINEPLPLPTSRERVWEGLREHEPFQSAPSSFRHSFLTRDALAYTPTSGAKSNTFKKQMVFIIDKYTPQGIINIAIALKAQNKARIVYCTREGDVMIGAGSVLYFEPGIEVVQVSLPHNLRVCVRATEIVRPDGGIGFLPDAKQDFGSGPVGRGKMKFKDPAVMVACDFCTKRTPQKQAVIQTSYSLGTRDRLYKNMPNPSMEYKLLGLFKLWNAIQFFYPYKDQMARPWSEVLEEYLPKVQASETVEEYVLCIAKVIAQTGDFQCFMQSPVLSNYVGTHVPPINVKSIAGNFYIAHVSAIEHLTGANPDLTRVKPGDIITAVDGVPVQALFEKLAPLYSASSPYGLNWRVSLYLLAGQINSIAKVTLKRGKTTYEAELLRSTTPAFVLNELEQLSNKLPVFTATHPSDRTVGYMDLTRLLYSSVDIAMHSMIDKRAIILDLRGPTKKIMPELARWLSTKTVTVTNTTTPYFSPSTFLYDGLSSSSMVSKQLCYTSHDDRQRVFKGRLVALISTATLGQGEIDCLYLKACRPDCTIIGQTTHGVTGNATNVVLPGGITAFFTGKGLTSGKSGFHCGITPDILVEDTVATLMQTKRDHVLERAMEFLKQEEKKPTA